MKRALSFALCLLMLVAVYGCSAPAATGPEALAEMDPIVIKYAHAIPEGELVNYIIEDWMAEVTSRSDGKITFDYHPHGDLGSYVEIIEQVELGTVDMSSVEPSLYEPWCPEISMFYAPFICDSYDHLLKSIYGKPGELVSQAMSEKSNTYILRMILAGARVIASTKPLRTLEDMNGLIIRSPESQVYIDTFALAGMSPAPMPMNEMYAAIQQGVVEACDCPAQSLYEGGYHLITGNICKTRHMYSLGTLSANEAFWDGLPEAARVLMLEVWDELDDDFNKRVQATEDEYYAKFEADGTLVTEFEDRAAFKEIAEPYWAEKASSVGGKAADILEAINSLR